MRRERRGGQTLQATALVHEAYLRLFEGAGGARFGNGAHFFAAAAEAMRRILVEQARRRKQVKRGGGRRRVDFAAAGSARAPGGHDPADVLAVHQVLAKLERLDPRMANVVKLRYFVGMTIAEAADALGLTSRTVNREWLVAKAWLARELAGGTSEHDDGAAPVPGPGSGVGDSE
jgi:RNA polymerase sigma factor (TIGR02999 family)